MTFAGVQDIEVRHAGLPDVFKYHVGMMLTQGEQTKCILAIDYGDGGFVLGSRVVARTFRQRLSAAWRVLRGGIA